MHIPCCSCADDNDLFGQRRRCGAPSTQIACACGHAGICYAALFVYHTHTSCASGGSRRRHFSLSVGWRLVHHTKSPTHTHTPSHCATTENSIAHARCKRMLQLPVAVVVLLGRFGGGGWLRGRGSGLPKFIDCANGAFARAWPGTTMEPTPPKPDGMAGSNAPLGCWVLYAHVRICMTYMLLMLAVRWNQQASTHTHTHSCITEHNSCGTDLMCAHVYVWCFENEKRFSEESR